MWEVLWIVLAVFWIALPALLLVALIGSVVLGRLHGKANGRHGIEPALTTGHGDL